MNLDPVAPEWRRAEVRTRGLVRMAAQERAEALASGVVRLEAVPGEEPRRLVRQILRHLEALLSLGGERPAAVRVDDMVRAFARLYEAHPLLRWPSDGVSTACRVAGAVAGVVTDPGWEDSLAKRQRSESGSWDSLLA